MLSWFKKKKDVAPDVVAATVIAPARSPSSAPSPSQAEALIRRWDLVIAEVHARLQAVLSEAVIASDPIIATITSDLNPLVLPWNTITPRMRDACEEVSEAWNTISDEMSSCDGFTHEMMRHEGNKRDLATLELALLHDREYGGVMARAAERMRRHAIASDAATYACNQCGARLDKIEPVASSLNVACGYCGSVNTVHPSTALRMFAASGAMHLAAEAARPANEAMRRLETRIKQYRDAKEVPLELLVDFEATSRRYWTTHLEALALHDPDQVKYVAAKLERYMLDILKTLRRYWQWREHEARRNSGPTML